MCKATLTSYQDSFAIRDGAVLVVDDYEANRHGLRLLLERAGHRVVTADDGRKGLALCQTEDFDLLFLDIFMPGMDGFETMRMVRQHRPQIPIIVISATAGIQVNTRRMFKEAGKRGLLNLKGHRSVGGMRASIYNALGLDAVEALVGYMAEFEKEHS